jgi:Asp-tRNA(Asn)/Glu-tRNA(Gln) amidotransferase C subunit
VVREMSKRELKEKSVSEFKRELIEIEKRFKEIDEAHGNPRKRLSK